MAIPVAPSFCQTQERDVSDAIYAMRALKSAHPAYR
jgi:hypothetical protein